MILDVQVEAEFLASITQSNFTDKDVLSLVEPGYFSVESYSWFVNILKKRNWEIVPLGFLDQLLIDNVREEDKRLVYRGQLEHLYVRDLTFVKDAAQKFKAFIAYNTVKASVKESFEGFERSGRVDYLLRTMEESVGKAKSIISDNKIQIVDYGNDWEERMARRKSERDNPSLRPIIKTGIDGLDQQFILRGPIILNLLAPFKRFKSVFLNSFGFAALLQNFNVAHIVYENTIELTTSRYDALFGQIDYNRITNLAISKEERAQLDVIFNSVKHWQARLKVIKGIPDQTSILEIVDEIDKLRTKEGWVPDVCILDYLNIVKSAKNKKEERLEQRNIVWEVKNMAEKFNMPVFTASQAVREAATQERMTAVSQGLSTDISRGVDLSIAIQQSEEERQGGLIVLNPLFYRGGEISIPEIVCDADISKMLVCRSVLDLWGIAREVHGF